MPAPPARRVAIVGGGPAGLMAAEVLAADGVAVDLYDAMASVGRKFLLAGRGGLNLTHSEPLEAFLQRYGSAAPHVRPWLEAFPPDALRAWAAGLGVDTFVGSSGRVFPVDMKAAPLLRAWLHRLRAAGVRIHARHRWIGWEGDAPGADPFRPEPGAPRMPEGGRSAAAAADRPAPADRSAPASGSTRPPPLRLQTRDGFVRVDADALILALGGASWRRLGSDGAWVAWLASAGVGVEPLRPANCGFDVRPSGDAGAASQAPASGWSDHFRTRFAGHPLKTVALAVGAPDAPVFGRKGEFVVTETGIEGSLVYAASASIMARLAPDRPVVVHVDLLPDRSLAAVTAEVQRPRGSRSLSTHLRSRLGLHGVKAALLRECLPAATFEDAAALARAIKALPLTLVAARPIDEAISSAGGVRFDALTGALMLRGVPGVFCAGEMIDWEAPTGGYLLTACLASGVVAARGVLASLGAASDPAARP
jgi:uncharacterized flavoprotein (TIGR03862 family)